MKTCELRRGPVRVGSFFSALGHLRETRLTAGLGYLVSKFPDEFAPLIFGSLASIDSVSVEETAAGDRYDVVVRGDKSPTILEGKVGHQQSPAQLRRYIRDVRKTYKSRPALTLIDDGSFAAQAQLLEFQKLKSHVSALRFITWTDVAAVCQDITRRKTNAKQNPVATAITEDFLQHLKENNMTNEPKPEVYLRDVSGKETVELFFRHNIYTCQSEYYKSASPNLYFAPYFTKRAADTLSHVNLVPVGEGISYVAQIKSVQVINRKGVREYFRENKIRDFKDAATIVERYHRAKEVLIMLLGPPRLVFLSPVTKKRLSRVRPFGNGAMGSRSCSFDDLFAASAL